MAFLCTDCRRTLVCRRKLTQAVSSSSAFPWPPLHDRAARKKRRHELLAVRAGRPVTQTTPGGRWWNDHLITGITTHYYRCSEMQIQKSKFAVNFSSASQKGSPEPPLEVPAIDPSVSAHNASNAPESLVYEERSIANRQLPAWIKLAAIAAGTVLAGGLAATWMHRKTLLRLQNAEETGENSNFRILDREAED